MIGSVFFHAKENEQMSHNKREFQTGLKQTWKYGLPPILMNLSCFYI